MDAASMGVKPSVLELLDRAEHKRALFVGETIEDVYHYVAPLGRPPKEMILSMKFLRTERFMGGVEATAEHARTICKGWDILSDRIVRKERYIEQSHLRKLFQVYTDTDRLHVVPVVMRGYDVVAVTDYGHGMLDGAGFEDVKFLAVNVQTNSENYGFNLATKYERADYLVVDELEARLATHNQKGQIAESIEALSSIAPKVVITLGRDGAIGWSAATGIVRATAFTDRVVDTLGAGDAFFAVTALIAEEADIESLLLIGNAAGALKAQIVGHSHSVTKKALIEYLATHGTR